MSADNWAICPRCVLQRDAAIREREEVTEKAYGKVTAPAYLELLAKLNEFKLNEFKAIEQESTFREDYALGVTSTGEFVASYSGHCTKCGLSFSYEHKQSIDLSQKPPVEGEMTFTSLKPREYRRKK